MGTQYLKCVFENLDVFQTLLCWVQVFDKKFLNSHFWYFLGKIYFLENKVWNEPIVKAILLSFQLNFTTLCRAVGLIVWDMQWGDDLSGVPHPEFCIWLSYSRLWLGSGTCYNIRIFRLDHTTIISSLRPY